MKFVSFIEKNKVNKGEQFGFLVNKQVISLDTTANHFIQDWDKNLKRAKDMQAKISHGIKIFKPEQIELLSPVPKPRSCRDAYAFRQHVETARLNRGKEMIPEFDLFPVFYFTNHQAVIGAGDVLVEQEHLNKLDFELEVAIVISKAGKNIKAQDADNYIAGLMIMNDFSARELQMQEMKLNLGPAKGKDFATSFGPWLVSMDELESRKTPAAPGHTGNAYDLKMKAFHNGNLISEGNLKDMNWTFAEIIERASYGVQLFPGDVIGSGTVGTGCYLELNGTKAREAQLKGETHTSTWLEPDDVIELDVEMLGKLSNKIVLNS